MTKQLSDNQPFLTLADLDKPVDFVALYGRNAPVEVEVGAGRGDFLIAYGKQNPHLNLLGIERKLVIVRRAASKVARATLENVRILQGELYYVVENYLLAGSLSAIHCYFPDPWPKKRHARRRVFRDDVTETFFRLLKPGGEVHLRTDVPDYFDVMEGLFEADRRFCRVSSPHALLSCKTGFECRFIAKGKLIFHASFRVVTDSSA